MSSIPDEPSDSQLTATPPRPFAETGTGHFIGGPETRDTENTFKRAPTFEIYVVDRNMADDAEAGTRARGLLNRAGFQPDSRIARKLAECLSWALKVTKTTRSPRSSQVIVGMTEANATSHPEIKPQQFWSSMSRLKGPLSIVDCLVSTGKGTHRTSDTWAKAAASQLHAQLEEAGLGGDYRVHRSRASFDLAINGGYRLDQSYGNKSGNVWRIFVIDDGLSGQTDGAQKPDAHFEGEIYMTEVPSAEAVESAVTNVTENDYPKEDRSSMKDRERVEQAINCLINWSLHPARMDDEWQMELKAARDEGSPYAHEIRAEVTKAVITEFLSKCPEAASLQFLISAGEEALSDFNAMRKVVFFE